MPRLLLLVAVLSTGAWAALARAETDVVLIDSSGSMKPFYANGDVQRLCTAIAGAYGRPPSVAAFAESQRPAAGCADGKVLAPQGKLTLLDAAIRYAAGTGAGIAWMVTDNVQDSGPAEASSTEAFYERLHAPDVSHIDVFPLVQRRSAGGSIVGGIVVYAIGFEVDPARYERQVEAVSASLTSFGTERLLMKPLTERTLSASLTATGADARVVPVNEVVHDSFEVHFRSNLPHLDIVDAPVDVHATAPMFEEESVLLPERMDLKVTPEKVRRLGAGAETEEAYVVSVDVGRVAVKHDLRSLVHMAFGRPREDFHINFAASIHVPRGHFRFRQPILERYNARSTEEAKVSGRIYALEKLPELVGETTTSIETPVPRSYRVRYPWWPAVVLLGGGALLAAALAGLVALVIMAFRPRAVRWSVTIAAPNPLLEVRVAGRTVLLSEDDAEIPVGSIADGVFSFGEGFGNGTNDRSVTLEDGVKVKLVQGKLPRGILTFTHGRTKRARPSPAPAEKADDFVPPE